MSQDQNIHSPHNACCHRDYCRSLEQLLAEANATIKFANKMADLDIKRRDDLEKKLSSLRAGLYINMMSVHPELSSQQLTDQVEKITGAPVDKQVSELAQQRDELLKALIGMLPESQDAAFHDGGVVSDAAVNFARRAIANAKGGAA
jgi:hypothetical protein